MKKLIFSFLTLLFVSCLNQENETAELHELVQEINKKCPATIDSETRLDRIDVVNGDMLRYNFSLVNLLVTNTDTARLRKELWPGIVANIKVSASIKKLRDQGLAFQYYYKDKEGNSLLVLNVTKEDYK